MARVLGVDYGRSRVGLAVSDALGVTAQPLKVLERPKGGSLLQAVLDAAREVEAERIVVGLPLKMDGSEGVATEAVRSFTRALSERTDVPVVLWDERLSTVEASRGMRSAGVSERDQRGVVDKVAAAVVLRSYLESHMPQRPDVSEAVLPEIDLPEIDRSGVEPPPARKRSPGGAKKRRRAPRPSRKEWLDE